MKVIKQQFSFELNPQEAFHLKQLVAYGRLYYKSLKGSRYDMGKVKERIAFAETLFAELNKHGVEDEKELDNAK